MFNVACFCGCCYSFSDGAGACPRCGKAAAVPVPSPRARTGRGQAMSGTLKLSDGHRTPALTDATAGAGERLPSRPGPGDLN
jgi:hypothetical protein